MTHNIIPQEEPKQYPIGGYAPGYYSCTCVTCKTEFMGDKRAVQCEPCAIEMVSIKIVENNGSYQIEKPKQETLEEAAEKNYENKTSQIPVPTSHWVDSKQLQIQNFIEGAKWQAERMYSEEGVLKILRQFNKDKPKLIFGVEEWFEQFKNK